MIPLRHTLPKRTTPFVTRGLVLVNMLSFGALLFAADRTESIIRIFGFIPARLVDPAPWGFAWWDAGLTLLSSLFLHGGLVHLFGNLVYLWVFGDAVEDSFGHKAFAAFFVACGVAGSLTHTLFFSESTIPSIGASGSIAGILGAFLVLRPRARIVTLFPLIVYWAMAEVRALIFLPIWFAMQFFNGFLALTAARKTNEVAGIAWWAHVGGFVFGAVVAAFVRVRRGR